MRRVIMSNLLVPYSIADFHIPGFLVLCRYFYPSFQIFQTTLTGSCETFCLGHTPLLLPHTMLTRLILLLNFVSVLQSQLFVLYLSLCIYFPAVPLFFLLEFVLAPSI